MEAFVLEWYGRKVDLALRHVSEPEVGPHDVLVKVDAAAKVQPGQRILVHAGSGGGLGGRTLRKSLGVLRPGGIAVGIFGPRPRVREADRRQP